MRELKEYPLWRECLSNMEPEYGKEYPNEFFEEQLQESCDSSEFRWSMMKVQSQIKHFFDHSYVLTAEGMSGKGFRILPANEHADYGKRKMRHHLVELRRIYHIATHTDTTQLNETEAADLEKMGATAVKKLFLLKRHRKIESALIECRQQSLLEPRERKQENG